MRKWMCIILILMTITTSACSSGDSGETAGNEKTATKEDKTVVTLSIQQASPFYETLEKKFEEKYPDIDLQIKAYLQAGEQVDSANYEKYQKTMNTELLSGKGADIYEISRLPFEEYVSKQLFLNMDDLMEQDKTLDKSDLEMNILNAIKMNGGTYAIPSGFSLRAFVGDGSVLENANIDDKNWTWDEFTEIAKQIIQKEQENGNANRYAIADYPPDVLLQEMVVDHYPEFVDSAAKKAMFDSPVFLDTMQQIKKMYDDKVMTAGSAEVGKQIFFSTVVQSPADLINGPHALFSSPKLLQKPHAQGQSGGMRIIPMSQFAIQAKSQVQEEAWKLIAFLLSAEGQSLQDREGFSLLKSVNEKTLNDIQQQVKSGTYKLADGKAVQVSDEEFTRFKQLIDTADNFAVLDGKVVSIVSEEGLTFFGGQKSAEEVAKLIQNRITTYLNE
ncbi:ABC transporter substrate-binding protein [Paenibacillus sepulcri]|uniref:ABC transporter substrate-binding protein n=1 Tax=Paenibacillus sepulcri TaxID=359917 RepID=A0ABS7C0M4_9BACL|nr:ABC transporter substrate-binding protein [Paenibacillus sepulcri]